MQQQHETLFRALHGEKARADRLCELNVIEQVSNVCRTSIVQDAWTRGQALAVHGWIYSLHDGLLRDLNATATSVGGAAGAYRGAIDRLAGAASP